MIREAVREWLRKRGWEGVESWMCRFNDEAFRLELNKDHLSVWAVDGFKGRVARIYFGDPDFFVKVEEFLK